VSFTITRGGSSVVLPNPVRGNMDGLRRLQVSAESIGGTFYAYDRGANVREMSVQWELKTVTQRDALLAFFDTVAVGMKNTVDLSFTDWRPVEFGGSGGAIALTGWRFATPTLEPVETHNGFFRVSAVFRSN